MDWQRANGSGPSAEEELQQQQEQQQAATEAYLKPIEFSGRSSEPEARLALLGILCYHTYTVPLHLCLHLCHQICTSSA